MRRTRTDKRWLIGGALLAGGAIPILLDLSTATAALRRHTPSSEEQQAIMERSGGRYTRWVLLPGLALLGGITGYATKHERTLANRLLAGAAAGALGTLALDGVYWWGFGRGYMGKENPETVSEHFGRLILGPKAAASRVSRLGYAYRWLVGAGFGITLALLAGPARWSWGSAWGGVIWLGNMVTPPTLLTGAGPFMYRRGWRRVLLGLAAHLAFGTVTGLGVQSWARPKGGLFALLGGPTS